MLLHERSAASAHCDRRRQLRVISGLARVRSTSRFTPERGRSLVHCAATIRNGYSWEVRKDPLYFIVVINFYAEYASFTAEMLIFVGRGRAADARVAAKG